MTYTVMVTSVAHTLAPDTLTRLRYSTRHDLRVIAVDRRKDVEARHFADAFECVESWDADGFAYAIADLVKKHKVDLVIPLVDEDALALSAHRNLLSRENCQLACNDNFLTQTLTDKLRSYELFTHAGLPTADWRAADSREHLITAVEQMFGMYGEVVVKPAVAHSSRGVSVIRNTVQGVHEYLGSREVHMDYTTFMTRFVDVYDSLFPVLVMKRLREPVYDLDVLAWEGKLCRAVPRRRINSAVPDEGHEIVVSSMLQDLARDVASRLNLSWLVDCDVMFDENGAVCLLEINARPSLSSVVSIAAGVPLLDDLISIAQNNPIPELAITEPRLVVPYRAMARAQND